MTCRDCVHYKACAEIVYYFLLEQHPHWDVEWCLDCPEFDKALTNGSEDTAAAGSTMDEVGAQLINLYAEYSRMAEHPDDDYAKAVCIAVRMLSD